MYGSTAGAGTGQAIFTDDVSLQVFMEHLKRLVSVRSLARGLQSADILVCVGCWCADKLELETAIWDAVVGYFSLSTFGIVMFLPTFFLQQNAMTVFFFVPSKLA